MEVEAAAEAGGRIEALFRASDSHLLGDVAAFGIGTAMTTGPGVGVAAGAVTQFGSARFQWPSWILVQADEDGVRLYGSDKKGTRGPQLLVAAPGTFRAALYRTLGQVQLSVFVPEQPPVTLKAKSGFRNRVPTQLARAVMDMAKAS